MLLLTPTSRITDLALNGSSSRLRRKREAMPPGPEAKSIASRAIAYRSARHASGDSARDRAVALPCPPAPSPPPPARLWPSAGSPPQAASPSGPPPSLPPPSAAAVRAAAVRAAVPAAVSGTAAVPAAVPRAAAAAGGLVVPGGVQVGQHDGDDLVDHVEVGVAGHDRDGDRVARRGPGPAPDSQPCSPASAAK